tara:strand:- start:31185 stop:33185 length:2001 start_codon:yes stop_codon:yes gene_type:complete
MTKIYIKFRKRIMIVSSIIIFSWIGLCVRLFNIQILDSSDYRKTLIKQAQKKHTLKATRGNIYDRNNKPFTRNIIHYTLSAIPSRVTQKLELAEMISRNTGKSVSSYVNKLNSKENFVYLERNLDRQSLGDLGSVNIDGFQIKRHYRRYYPHNSIGAQIIGYTNIDDNGISGVEKDFDKYLIGVNGWIIKTKGWKGRFQNRSGNPYQKPINGNNIQLTIDLEYQSILEEELARRQKETSSIAATGIIMNPQTGEILAIASTPGFNNNKFSKTKIDYHRVRAVTDQFEPGSTFKIVAAISALLKNNIDISDEFNCENGLYPYYDITVSDHEKYGFLTFSQIIQNSSNIGIVKIMDKVGSMPLYNTARDLGFGTKTGISISGEYSGDLHPVKSWSHVSKGQIAMGYEVGVTAIQLATAYCAIANGGYLVSPTLIRQIAKNNGDIIYKEEPTILRRVADEKVMGLMKKMLRSVVSNGTGLKAEIAGWEIAGKTGTAKKAKNGSYNNAEYISNFVGMFPFEDPQLLGLIILDEPSKPFHWGSEGAAVAFSRTMKRIINLDDNIKPPFREKPKYKESSNDSYQDDIILAKLSSQPKSSLMKVPPSLSMVSTKKNKAIKIPDLRGFSMRKAMRELGVIGLKPRIDGSGKVSWQSPEPGTVVKYGSTCIISLK